MVDDTDERAEPPPEAAPPTEMDVMAVLAALLSATGLLRGHKRKPRKRP